MKPWENGAPARKGFGNTTKQIVPFSKALLDIVIIIIIYDSQSISILIKIQVSHR
jgi:hypothetical protein